MQVIFVLKHILISINYTIMKDRICLLQMQPYHLSSPNPWFPQDKPVVILIQWAAITSFISSLHLPLA